MQALGAVQLRIANRFSSSSGSVIGPAPGVSLTAKGIRIEVSGQNGGGGSLSGTPKAASFGTGNNVKALVLVPNGTLATDTSLTATGALLGRDVDISTGSTVTFQDGFLGCSAATCNDNNACTVDSCNPDGTCGHTPAPAGTTCSDGNACTADRQLPGGRLRGQQRGGVRGLGPVPRPRRLRPGQRCLLEPGQGQRQRLLRRRRLHPDG